MITDERAALEWLRRAKSKENAHLAVKIAAWLASHNYGCALTETDDGVSVITYAENRGEGNLQPTIHVEAGRIKFPKGTNLDLMMAFLGDA